MWLALAVVSVHAFRPVVIGLYMAHLFCLVFSKKFNIMSALSAHQAHALPQKIDSRESCFDAKKGLACTCGKMNIYFKRSPFVPLSGLFAAKRSAFWCKMEYVLVQNARHFGAKRKVKCC